MYGRPGIGARSPHIARPIAARMTRIARLERMDGTFGPARRPASILKQHDGGWREQVEGAGPELVCGDRHPAGAADHDVTRVMHRGVEDRDP